MKCSNSRKTAVFCLLLLLFTAAANARSLTDDELRAYENALLETGIGYDQIRPIEKPRFASMAEASLSMTDEEIVFALETPESRGPFPRTEGVRLYPRRYMLWHEVVNDTVDGVPASIVYSPLTGAVLGVFGEAGRYRTNFGNSGMLLNAGTVLYDRATGSLWPLLLATAVKGPLTGVQLKKFPLIWTTWDRAKEHYPDAQVLARPRRSRRPYGKDPYGSYTAPSYYNDQRILHPLTRLDKRLPPKTRVFGVEQGTANAAIVRDDVFSSGLINFAMGDTPLMAVADRGLGTVRVFDTRVDGRALTFYLADGLIYDEETATEWTKDGIAVSGPLADTRLRQFPAYECMWFAWASFNTMTSVIRENSE